MNLGKESMGVTKPFFQLLYGFDMFSFLIKSRGNHRDPLVITELN